MTTTITPVVTPQQQMILAFHGFPLPEGTEVEVILPSLSATIVKAKRVKVWTIREDGQWAEAIGFDTNIAVKTLVDEIARNRKAN